MKHRDLQISLLKQAGDRIAIRLAQAEEQGDAQIQEAVEFVEHVKKVTKQEALEAAVKGLVWDARRQGLRESLEIFREILKDAQRKNTR